MHVFQVSRVFMNSWTLGNQLLKYIILATAMIRHLSLEVSLLLTVCLGAGQKPPDPPSFLPKVFTFSGHNKLCLSNNCTTETHEKRRSVLECSRWCISSDCVGFYFEKDARNCVVLTPGCLTPCLVDGTRTRIYVKCEEPRLNQTICAIEGTGCWCSRGMSQVYWFYKEQNTTND